MKLKYDDTLSNVAFSCCQLLYVPLHHGEDFYVLQDEIGTVLPGADKAGSVMQQVEPLLVSALDDKPLYTNRFMTTT